MVPNAKVKNSRIKQIRNIFKHVTRQEVGLCVLVSLEEKFGSGKNGRM